MDQKIWFFQKGFPQGAFWAIMTALVSILNDVITRNASIRLNGLEVLFFRFLFSILILIPFMIRQGKSVFSTQHLGLHLARAIIGVSALVFYLYSLQALPLVDVTSLSFGQPLFLLVLAALFLKEHVSKSRWIATVAGFLGILVILHPGHEAFNPMGLLPIGAAFLFACLDALAKRMVSTETTFTLLFYFGISATLASLIPALYVWQEPTFHELLWMFLLGVGANLIQVCLFLAFSASDASSLAPFRYMELVFASFFGYWLFAEIPTLDTYVGASIIIVSTLYLSYHEKRKRR